MEDTRKKHKAVQAQTLGQFAQSSIPGCWSQEPWMGAEEVCLTSRKVHHQERSAKDVRREAPSDGKLPSPSPGV